ncbi:MAG: type II toxin-antitoxin system VapC family toxin [Gammaproteobacteria bacterium]|nr:type II toxin-antitoxin system VapC family toxin [Gammaproteobacteria bacterium]
MILLDTNIISEIMKPLPQTEVVKWLNQQESSQLFISTLTIAEISYGMHVLPEGRRRNQIEDAFNKVITAAFKLRVLSFDAGAGYVYGKIMARKKSLGKPMGIPDGQIAAIAYSQGYALATRNTRDFTGCGLELVNPFDKFST